MAINFLNTPSQAPPPNMTTVTQIPEIRLAGGAPAASNPFDDIDTSSDFEIARRLQDEENAAQHIPWPEPLIKHSKLVIRPYHPTDAPALAKMANNKNISRNMTDRFPHPYTLADAEAFIAKALDPKKSNVYAWTISIKSNSRPIGGCGLEPGPDVFARNAEIGYWLGEEYWGKGYGTMVCQALTDWAFRQESGVNGNKLQRVGAGVFDQNPASEAVLKKCGYSHDGTMRGIVYKYGEVRDLEIWGMTRKNWEKRTRRKSAMQEMKLISMTEGTLIGSANDAF